MTQQYELYSRFRSNAKCYNAVKMSNLASSYMQSWLQTFFEMWEMQKSKLRQNPASTNFLKGVLNIPIAHTYCAEGGLRPVEQ